jgi:hypothetical protein
MRRIDFKIDHLLLSTVGFVQRCCMPVPRVFSLVDRLQACCSRVVVRAVALNDLDRTLRFFDSAPTEDSEGSVSEARTPFLSTSSTSFDV